MEKEKAVAIATRMGRTDVVIAIDLAYELGLRVEEICVTRIEYLISARNTGIFVVSKGKDGQSTGIPTDDKGQRKAEIQCGDRLEA